MVVDFIGLTLDCEYNKKLQRGIWFVERLFVGAFYGQ
jgi:hypothetical protein